MFLDDFVDTVLPGLPANTFGAMDQLIASCAARFVGAPAALAPAAMLATGRQHWQDCSAMCMLGR